MLKVFFVIFLCILSFDIFSSVEKVSFDGHLKFDTSIKQNSLMSKNLNVLELLNVMKTSSYSDQERWSATMNLARKLGSDAAPVLKKFTRHPYWLMRMASLRALELLKIKDKEILIRSLNDQSLFVKSVALEMISSFSYREVDNHVWNMIFDRSNYQSHQKSTFVIFKAIEVLKKVSPEKFDLRLKAFAKKMNDERINALVFNK